MKLSLHSLLLFAGLFLFFIRCDITDQDFEKDITIADVQEYYSNLDLDHTNGRSDEISILWEDASYKDVTTGKALVFPIESTTRQYVSLEEQNVLVPINRATHAFAYKDEEDQIHLDYVLELQLEDTDLFTGYTIVGSWGSEPDRVYTYEDGNLIDGQSDGRLELDCVTTDYYECTSVSVGDVIYGNSCTLVRRSITCISTAPSQLAPEDFGTRGGGGGDGSDSPALCPHPSIVGLMVPCEESVCEDGYVKDENGDCIREIGGFNICSYINIAFDKIPNDDYEDSYTGEIQNIHVPAIHRSSGQHVQAFWGGWCLTYGTSTQNVNSSIDASNIFKESWFISTTEIEVWLNTLDQKPTDYSFSQRFRTIFERNLATLAGGSIYLSTGGCSNTSATRLRYCK